MSSTKSKDKIQKKVEASILDAVTKFKSDEISLNQYEKTKQLEADSILIGDKSAQILWDLAKEDPLAQNKEAQDLKNKSHSYHSHQQVPKDEKTSESKEADLNAKDESDFKSESADLKTIAIDIQTHKSSDSYPPTPSSDLKSTQLEKFNNFNLMQYKLYEGEHLKIAQTKIEELEASLDKLRLENERLATASELFQKRADDAVLLKQEFEKKLNFNEERFSEERDTLKDHIEQRDETIKELKDKIEHLETRLTADIRKSRSKERELENRLELTRLEKISLVGSKDDIILDLKRQVD